MFSSASGRRSALFAIALVLAAVSCLAAPPANIILLIGDGMGIGHVTAARVAGPGPDGRLAMDTMPFTGLLTTHSASSLVTDSAAAGTALAAGVKTKNGVISLDANGKEVRSILEVARDMGKATGIVSTKSVTDATPAVFASHVENRGQALDIAAQMLSARVHVILGGGKRDFTLESAGGKRTDGRDLVADAAKRGYAVCETAIDLDKAASDRILGLFSPDSLRNEKSEPTIAQMTSKAISVLSRNGKGFFMMSEGGKIDSEAHGNNADGVVIEMLMFDDAVRAALDFARKDGRTLVIVTADHNTGGLAVREPDKDNPKFKAGWVSGGHNANMVPLFAYGPGAENFTGIHDNTEVPRICARLWGQRLN